MASRAQPSPPFASRELNGDVLLGELAELRTSRVQQRFMNDCLIGLRELQGMSPQEAAAQLKAMSLRFTGQPALAALLVRWATRLKSELDVPVLVDHLERLVLASALLTGVRRAAENLPRGR